MKKKILFFAIISAAVFLNFNSAIASTNSGAQELRNQINQRIAEIRSRIAARGLTKNIVKNPSASPVAPTAMPSDESLLSGSKVIQQTNLERQKAGLAPLIENEKLNKAALAKAQDMLSKQYFAHVSPDGVGLVELLNSVGYIYQTAGENLAYGNFNNENKIVDGWMASPGHRANILNSKYTQIGVAVIKGIYQGKRVWMAVQEFGTPR